MCWRWYCLNCRNFANDNLISMWSYIHRWSVAAGEVCMLHLREIRGYYFLWRKNSQICQINSDEYFSGQRDNNYMLWSQRYISLKKSLVPITLPYLVFVPYPKVFLPIPLKNELFLPKISLAVLYIGLHTVNTKQYDTGTGTGETVPMVSVSLTVKRYLWSPRPDRLFTTFMSLTSVVPFLNSMTTINSRIGEPTIKTDIDEVNRSKWSPQRTANVRGMLHCIVFPAECYSRQRVYNSFGGNQHTMRHCRIWFAVTSRLICWNEAVLKNETVPFSTGSQRNG